TALLGAGMCFAQQHLKRMLAFSTISHMGLFLFGLGLFDHDALAGVALYVLAHGLAKGALFLACGIVIYRLASIDAAALRGRGRRGTLAVIGGGFGLGALGLAELPPFGWCDAAS